MILPSIGGPHLETDGLPLDVVVYSPSGRSYCLSDQVREWCKETLSCEPFLHYYIPEIEWYERTEYDYSRWIILFNSEADAIVFKLKYMDE